MKYIESILQHNKFTCKLTALFEGTDNVDMKAVLDTGCTNSHISIDKMFIFLGNEQYEEKEKWMNMRDYTLGTGVESNNKINNNKITYTKLDVSNPRIMVANRYYNVHINGINIGNGILFTSYDTSDVALIGMSIMKDWDIHIGKDITTGKVKLLACPNNQLNNDYFEALERIFGISSNIQSSFMRNKINKGEQQ
jgi:hypothetical protein